MILVKKIVFKIPNLTSTDFENLALCLFTKYNGFLVVYPMFAINLTNFDPPK